MAHLTIDDFEIMHIICTVDFEQCLSLMDKRFELVEPYVERGFTQMIFPDPLVITVKTEDGLKEISIRMNQWGFVSRSCSLVEEFIEEAVNYLRLFSECSKIDKLNRVGLRIFYNYPLEEIECSPPEFPRLTDFFNIPGVEDERLADLIHYNVSTQREGRRDVLTLGQNREGRHYFLRPDLNSHDYGEFTIDEVAEVLTNAYKRLLDRFKGYLKGEKDEQD